MDRIRDRILEERWQIRQTELSFSCKQAEITPYPGMTAEGCFVIGSADGSAVEGFVRADDPRMRCLTPWFSGSEESISYTFDAAGMTEGESREGYFYVMSDCGEYRLPYRVTVVPRVLMSSLGEIGSLQQFTNLSRAAWAEAVHLFYHPDFGRILKEEPEYIRNLYRGFSAEKDNEQNVEQFLAASGKKQPISYSCAQAQIHIGDLRGNVKEEITVSRNGWGAVCLWVTTEGEFLQVDKKCLREEDFLGNQCRIPIYIEESRLCGGRNPGRVEVSWPGGSFSVDVTVERRSLAGRSKAQKRRQLKQYTLQMMRLYEKFRMKKMSAEDWQQEAWECVDGMMRYADQNPVPRLFRAHLLINSDRYDEAGWILDHAEPLLDTADPAVQGYYLYLDTLCAREESYVRSVERKLLELFDRNPREWRIAWLLLFLSRELNRNDSARWMFLEECFRQDCFSPVLYLEAILLLNSNPALLSRLDGYVRRILVYGAKNRILSKELIGQILYMSGREKYYDEHLYRILCVCHELAPDAEALQAVCTLLVKGGKTDREYHRWYLMGVEKNLRIARLYEYYMMSMDLEKEEQIPRSVLMYFAYRSDLDYEYAAYLYAYVEKHCKDEGELYAAYRPQIESFVNAQVQRGRITPHLAYLYEHYLQESQLTGEMGAALAALLPVREVEWTGDKVSLVMIHSRLAGEARYAFSNRTALIPFYGKEDILFVQDENGNRRLAESLVRQKKLFEEEPLLTRLIAAGAAEPGLCLLALKQEEIAIDEDNLELYMAAAEWEHIEPQYSRKVHMALLRYFAQQQMTDCLDALLERICPEQVEPKNRPEVVQMLAAHGFWDKGFLWTEGMDLKKLDADVAMQLCSSLLAEGRYEEDPRMTALCARAARDGRYDVHMLQQLIRDFEGDIRELESVYRAAAEAELDTFPLCERMIRQMLFTGCDVSERTDLLRRYVRDGGNVRVTAAFLHRCAVRYVMQNEPIHLSVISLMGQLMRQKERISGMCEVAYLEYFARCRDHRNTETDRYLLRIGEKMYKSGRLIPVLREYADLLPQAAYLEDKSFVVFCGQREEPAWIHYRTVREEPGNEAYVSMPMRHICGGMFAADFLLFAGETLQYYITWGQNDGQIAESGFLKPGADSEQNGQSKYAMLSAVTARRLEKQDGGSLTLLQEYLRTEHLVSRLFTMID